MTSHLYVLSIGPVQEFIAAARRTRDLWFGSYLLSEISKAAANEIAESGGELIFPALKKGDVSLKPSKTDEILEAFNVANVILAEIPEELSPQIIHDKAQKAAQSKWIEFASEAKERAENIVNDEIWASQVDDVIEINAAWVPVGDNYADSRKKLMRLLAGRKSLRNFNQPEKEFLNTPSLQLYALLLIHGSAELLIAEMTQRESLMELKNHVEEKIIFLQVLERNCTKTSHLTEESAIRHSLQV